MQEHIRALKQAIPEGKVSKEEQMLSKETQMEFETGSQDEGSGRTDTSTSI